MHPADDTFSLPGADGEAVNGDLYLPPGVVRPPLVVLVHGFKGFKHWGFFPWLARTLADAGLAVAAINFSHCGNTAGDRFERLDLFERDTWGKRLFDLRQVLNAAQAGALTTKAEPNPGRLGLLGHSMGGGAALLTAAADGRVRALGTLACVARADRLDSPEVREQLRAFGHAKLMNARTGQEMRLGRAYFDELEGTPQAFDLTAAAARLAVPWLLVHGEDDETVPLAEAHDLLEAATRNPLSGENVKLLSLSGTGHTFGAGHPFAGPTQWLEQAASALAAHFLRVL